MVEATSNYDPYAMPADALTEPPDSLWKALRKIGPGIILAGSIIGSGELLLTTGLGAKHGFAFLWLILFSCIIKVFVQIELGRYAISSAKPTLGALNELPGPRFGAHWLVWWWFFMLLATVAQLGAMVGGVGQALHLAFPQVSNTLAIWGGKISPQISEHLTNRPEHPWAVLTALLAVVLLLSGGYKRIELITTLMVASVTFITVACVLALPATGYPIHANEVVQGLTIQWEVVFAGVAAAFAAFGITGVGASELYSYPYWCLEKGYARFAGPRSADEQWARRAKGWIRVMYLDAWVSMVVFTVATVAFYCMGATVLHRQGLVPQGKKMMEELSQMYVPAFGDWTKVIFLVGAWIVLFKTLYVSCASHSRLVSDFFSLAGFVRFPDAAARGRSIRALCIFFPLLSLVLYLLVGEPRVMVVFGGFFQAATLPVISVATLYLRHFRTDPRLRPSRFWDLLLWTATISISVVAFYAIYDWFMKNLWPLLQMG